MVEGKGRADWARTSALMAMICNVNRDPKKGKASKPADFNPYIEKNEKDDRIELDGPGMKGLKKIFEGHKNG